MTPTSKLRYRNGPVTTEIENFRCNINAKILTWFNALDLPHGLDGGDLDNIVQVLDAKEVEELLDLGPQVGLGQGLE